MTFTALVPARKRIHRRSTKKFVICSNYLPFCITIECVVVDRQNHHASLMNAKRILQKEKFRSPNDDAWKGYSIFQGHCSWTPQGGFTVPHMNSKLHTRWVMAYNHKTQSFRKNGDQQKCFNKALKTVKKHPNKLDIRQFLVLLYDCVPNMKNFWSIVRFF